MVGRLLRVTGSVLGIAVALVTPVLATSTPASADMVINGCTIVSNPTPTYFTNCPGAGLAGANLSGVDLSYANLVGASFANCNDASDPPDCIGADLSGANLTDANLSGGDFAACGISPFMPSAACDAAGLSKANLTAANLTNAFLGDCLDFQGNVYCGDASLSGTTLTGANFTGTILVPSNDSVTATSQAGGSATWSTPPATIPGATPGSCTPASGSTFPLFSSTVTCQVLDANNDAATGTFQVNVQPTTQYFTRVLVPSEGAVLAGAPYLDAAAGDGPGATKVVFEVSGGTLSNQVIATASLTIYGWLAQWDTTTVPNGTYTLESVATDADNNTDTSTPITVTVNNQPPVTAVLIPSNGARLTGSTYLDASASNATSVEFRLFGGIYGYAAPVICTATPTEYGWLCSWNTTTVPNGSYALLSEAFGAGGSTFSPVGVSITVDNTPPSTSLLIPSSGATLFGPAILDAAASDNVGVTKVEFRLAGGTLNDASIATATPTLFGWIADWNSRTVPNGTYTLQSVAYDAEGLSTHSTGITVNVLNGPIYVTEIGGGSNGPSRVTPIDTETTQPVGRSLASATLRSPSPSPQMGPPPTSRTPPSRGPSRPSTS